MKLVYENRPYMHINVHNTVVLPIQGRREIPPPAPSHADDAAVTASTAPCDVPKAAPSEEECKAPPAVSKRSPASVPVRTVKDVPEPRRGAEASNKVSAESISPQSIAAPPASSRKATNRKDDNDGVGGGWHGLLVGVAIAGIIGLVALGVARRK